MTYRITGIHGFFEVPEETHYTQRETLEAVHRIKDQWPNAIITVSGPDVETELDLSEDCYLFDYLIPADDD